MNDEKVFAPFIEEIEDALRDSIARQQKAIRRSDLAAMEEEAARQKNLVSARRQLEGIQEAWSQLVSKRKHGMGQPSEGWDDQSQLPEQAQSTPPERYVLPILQVLVEFGGSASATEVTDRVGQLMASILNESDYDSFPSGRVRWRAYASGARLRMVRDGLLADDSPRGVWEITERGRAYLHEHQGANHGP
jgi:restriction system protein